MELFLSYRRDDTGGRAGRLFDTLVTRFGPDHVFQDVNTVAPGLNFVQQVETAIARSDVVLVVIGPNWLSSPDPAGGRRVDRPDDFVRREVRAALDGDVRVVPVLVDGAVLPLATELPDGLTPLLERQAVGIRDISWHQDVDDLIRRLQGQPRLPARCAGHRRPIIAGVVALIAAIIVASVVVANRGGSTDASNDEPSSCEPPTDSSWTPLQLVKPSLDVVVDGRPGRIDVRRADFRELPDGMKLVVVELAAANTTAVPLSGSDDGFYYSYAMFAGLLIDGVSVQTIECANSFEGDPQLEPGEVVFARVGYTTALDPAGAELELELGDDVVPGSS